ncbi:hypothetical protein BC829DRAFT_416717 [Chytridium lagenaria]|nr:hypothetical protein BC829DRAFT_416717 [Chytridium lagenaria]
MTPIASQQRQMNEHQQLIAELQSNLAKEAYVNESLRVKKKEDSSRFKKSTPRPNQPWTKNRKTSARKLTQKQIQATATLDEASRLKIEVSELTADRFRLEASRSDREIRRIGYGIKYQTLVEQLRRIDEEVGALKNVAGNEGDGWEWDWGLSRRIKNQLGLLLDAAPSSTSTMFTSSAPPVATTPSPGTLSSVPSTSERNVARGFFSTSPDREKSREREYKASSTFLAEERKARMGLENPKMISGLDEHLWEDDRRESSEVNLNRISGY